MIVVWTIGPGPLKFRDSRGQLLAGAAPASGSLENAGAVEVGDELEFVGGEAGKKITSPGLTGTIGTGSESGNQILASGNHIGLVI